MSDHSLARTIWHTSRADEGTISATGANHVATAVLDLLTSDRMREVVARSIAREFYAMEGGDPALDVGPDVSGGDHQIATAALAAIRTELEGARDE